MPPDPQLTSPTPTVADREASEERANQRICRDFLFAFHTALRALKLYPIENQMVQTSLAELDQIARTLATPDGFSVRYVGDFCFVNDLRLRVDMSSYATFGAVGRALRSHEIGQIEVGADVGVTDWTSLLSLLARDPKPEEPFQWFRERLERSSARNIQVTATVGEENVTNVDSVREAKQTYAHSIAVAREALLGARIGKAVSVRRVKRAIQQVVDQVLNNESSMLGMTVLREYDQYTFAHSVNVAIFSIALGKKLGLSKQELSELGMGALLHDIGKSRLPIELTTKATHLDEPEWEMVREHPTEGLLTLLEMRSIGDMPLRAMLTAYEHHMKIDQTGYPRSVRARDPTLFSRIVTVADGFDAATSKRSYQSSPWLPDMVLREMRENPSRGYDPLIVKAFISMTGIYPIGCLVVLDSFEMAVVIATNADSPHRPVVKVIFDEMGIPLLPPRTIDLGQVDPATGSPHRTIIKTTDPEKYGIDVKEYFA